jgi:CheY-like chemotaxis protein
MNDTCLLLVDDEAIILMALKMECVKRYKKADILTALNGEQALQCLKAGTHRRHVIISDYQMPGMKGDVLCRKIRQDYPDSILILLTGQAPDAVIEALKAELRLTAFLCKPWQSKNLYSMLDALLLE